VPGKQADPDADVLGAPEVGEVKPLVAVGAKVGKSLGPLVSPPTNGGEVEVTNNEVCVGSAALSPEHESKEHAMIENTRTRTNKLNFIFFFCVNFISMLHHSYYLNLPRRYLE